MFCGICLYFPPSGKYVMTWKEFWEQNFKIFPPWPDKCKEQKKQSDQKKGDSKVTGT